MRSLTRRQLIGSATAAAAAAALPGGLGTQPAAAATPAATAAHGATAPRIVIVGAGLAGIRCAHKLWTRSKPVAATVYEADTSHIGGRCWSLRGFFDGGQVSEHGGSFISSTDTSVLNLADSLGIKREYANGGALDSGDYTAWINNAPYGGDQQQSGWTADAYSAFSASFKAMGSATPRYNSYNQAALRRGARCVAVRGARRENPPRSARPDVG